MSAGIAEEHPDLAVVDPPERARVLAADAGRVDPLLGEAQLRMATERTADWQYHGLLFVTSTGKPYHGAEVLKAFKFACRRAGIAERRFHDLRASCATLMRELGVPEEVRMARLGHATRAMSRHYAQVRPGFDRDAVEAMRKALAG
jgi:integrase